MSSFLSSPNQSSFPTSFCSQVSLWLPQASLIQGPGKAASIHTALCPAFPRAQGPGSTQGLRFPGSVSRDGGDGPARQDLALAQISPGLTQALFHSCPAPQRWHCLTQLQLQDSRRAPRASCLSSTGPKRASFCNPSQQPVSEGGLVSCRCLRSRYQGCCLQECPPSMFFGLWEVAQRAKVRLCILEPRLEHYRVLLILPKHQTKHETTHTQILPTDTMAHTNLGDRCPSPLSLHCPGTAQDGHVLLTKGSRWKPSYSRSEVQTRERPK